MKNHVFAYVCAPKHTRRFKEYCRTLFRLGYVPVCPHLMFSFFADTPEQREARRQMSLQLLRRCRTIVICDELNRDDEMDEALVEAERLMIVPTTITLLEKEAAYRKKETSED